MHPVECLHGAANFPSMSSFGPGLCNQTQESYLMPSDSVPGTWTELRRAASSSYQTLGQFFPQHCSLHPWSPKLVCPDKKFCLACLPSFQIWTLAAWLWPGPDSQLSKLSFRGAPSSTTPCPSPPSTPQGCLVSQSKVPCKFWGRGVRWAGLRALV